MATSQSDETISRVRVMLPQELKMMIIHLSTPARFLDLRLRESFPPPGAAYAFSELRQLYLAVARPELPSPRQTFTPTFDGLPTAGCLQECIHPVWCTAKDILLVNAETYATTVMPQIQIAIPLTKIAILANGYLHPQFIWHNIMGNIAPGSLAEIILCYELQGPEETWSIQDIDTMDHDSEIAPGGSAEFIEEFGGIISGTAGATSLGKIHTLGVDVTHHHSEGWPHGFIMALETDLVRWLDTWVADDQQVPDVDIMALWPRSLPGRMRARYDELHPATSNGDYL